MGNFYGIKGMEFISRGSWSDPAIRYKGVEINYYDVEDSLYEAWKEETGLEYDGNEKAFEKWVKRNAYLAREFACNAMKPIAVMTMTNYGGFEIFDIDSDCVIVGENYGDGTFGVRSHSLYPLKDDYYFVRNGKRYRLSNFMKVA